MKHNPKLHERIAALPGNAKLHPLQDPAHAQGALAGVGLYNEATLGALVIIGLNSLMGPLATKMDRRVTERERARNESKP